MVAPFLHPFAPPAKPRDGFLTIVRGKGATVWDDDGNEYIDAMASLWYAAIGYGRQEMADVIGQQAAKLSGFHTFASFTNEPAEALAAEVAARSAFSDPRVFFCCSGSEAVDSAMKIARAAQGQAGNPERTLIVSRGRAYHGVNYGGTSVSGLPVNQEGYGPMLAATVTVDPDDLAKMEAVLSEFEGEVAAVITEPVQGAGGVFPPQDGYLEGLRELCDAAGAYLIFDEVITGFGRLGTWFAAQRFGVLPDLQTFAKAVTSGYVPLGGVIVGPGPRAALEADPDYVLTHGFTYSGHPLAAAAGLKNLEIMEREDLVARGLVIESKFDKGLHTIGAGGRLSDIRGVGGMWGVTTPDGVDEAVVSAEMRDRGVLARPAYGSLVFCPPLVTTDDELDAILGALDAALPD